MHFKKELWFAIICLLAFGSVAIINGCGDDDDDDNDDAGDDDDGADDDGAFDCGDDRQCHESHGDCLVDCDTLDCPNAVCLPAYRDCLDPDGCTLPFLDCKDNCGSDQNCLDECEGDYAGCFADECNADEACLNGCFDAWDECRDDCADDIGCLLGCLAIYDGCFWGCLPY